MMKKQLTVAVVGLGFGESFARIFACHPQVKKVYAVDRIAERVASTLKSARDEGRGTDKLFAGPTFEEVLADPEVDAVHVCTGIPSHAELTVRALRAGKHVLCAVPMGVTEEEIRGIVAAVRETGKVYMMAETAMFEPNYFYADEMKRKGLFGKIQFMRGVHNQPMDAGYWNTPVTKYWRGLPPMHYCTHVVSPLVGLADSRIERVVCMGAGTMKEELVAPYGNPYPVENALFRFENGMSAEASRGLFEYAAFTVESFDVYGSERTYLTTLESGPQLWEKFFDKTCYDHTNFRKTELHYKNEYKRLPKELWGCTVLYFPGCEEDENYLEKGRLAGHLGSHPHIVHEFVSAVLEGRKALVNEEFAGNVTLAGIIAHRSAMKGGEPMEVPKL